MGLPPSTAQLAGQPIRVPVPGRSLQKHPFSPLPKCLPSLPITSGSLCLTLHLLIFIAHVILACLEPWTSCFPSLNLLRIGPGNAGPEPLEGKAFRNVVRSRCVFVAQARPRVFEITSLPEICGVDRRADTQATGQSLRAESANCHAQARPGQHLSPWWGHRHTWSLRCCARLLPSHGGGTKLLQRPYGLWSLTY